MKRSPTTFKVGTRPSNLAVAQARAALDQIEHQLEPHRFEIHPLSTVGDRDRTTDLRQSPADFFTHELDTALLNGTIDCALHSAKDLPEPLDPEIDWFWLPHREEPRDALILRPNQTLADLPPNPIFGISSDRRATYTTEHFPDAIQQPIRGNIEDRLEQLDQGTFDVIIMAAAALNRLELQHRIHHFISLDHLPVPEGQGYLAITFRKGDTRFQTLRALYTPAVTIAGAGVGHRDLCTIATLRALQRCDLCLYDSLMDQRLLAHLPPHAEAIDVGKRCGAHTKEQHEITHLLCDYARRSHRIVRLKGGDPGIFGRLAEETEALEALALPYHVIPGISALQAATTSTGMLLTRRDLSRGFVALTPRAAAGKIAPCNAAPKATLPTPYYMAIKAMEPITAELLADGLDPNTPVAVVYNAGARDQEIIRTTLTDLPQHGRESCTNKPGLILIGENSTYQYTQTHGALEGKRILLTCSEALQQRAADLVRDYGGIPIAYPLIQLTPRIDCSLDTSTTDWIVISSPSSARAYLEIIEAQHIDRRTIPRIMVCGRGTAAVFAEHGIHVDAQPETNYSAHALAQLATQILKPHDRVLRLRSDKAGTTLAEALRQTGAHITDTILYDNHPIHHATLPTADILFFASASGVETFIDHWGTEALKTTPCIVIGNPTAKALHKHDCTPDLIAHEATVQSVVETLAAHHISNRLDTPGS